LKENLDELAESHDRPSDHIEIRNIRVWGKVKGIVALLVVGHLENTRSVNEYLIRNYLINTGSSHDAFGSGRVVNSVQ
jgi:hypothetical protein